jgi:hypothetical protein
MTDLSAAVLLYSAAIIVFYASLNIRPINRYAEWAAHATYGLFLSVAAVATIYATFAYDLETGVRWRPELKIISGFGAAVFAYKSWRIVNRRR